VAFKYTTKPKTQEEKVRPYRNVFISLKICNLNYLSVKALIHKENRLMSLFLLQRKKTVCRVGEKLITVLPIRGMSKQARNSFLYLMQIYRPDVAGFSRIRKKNCMLGHQVAGETGNVSLGKQWNIRNNISASNNYEVPWFESGRLGFRLSLFQTSKNFRTDCPTRIQFWVKFMSLSICPKPRF
jgi:hypothetical protein